jgi:hypothetical protein
MVDSNESFLREVKEELDRERLEAFWKKYGAVIIAAAAVAVLLVAGFQIWNSMRLRAAQQAGADYEVALEEAIDGKLEASAGGFSQLTKTAPGGYAPLAQLQYAATLLEQGRKDEALREFEALSKRDGADELIRGFASLQAAAIRLGNADFREMQNRLDPLIKEGGAWRLNALELLGMAAMHAGSTDKARETFGMILSDANAPPALQQRVNYRMAQLIAGEPPKNEEDGAVAKTGKPGEASQSSSGAGASETAN